MLLVFCQNRSLYDRQYECILKDHTVKETRSSSPVLVGSERLKNSNNER